MLRSIDSCQHKVSTDQFHVIICGLRLRAHGGHVGHCWEGIRTKAIFRRKLSHSVLLTFSTAILLAQSSLGKSLILRLLV